MWIPNDHEILQLNLRINKIDQLFTKTNWNDTGPKEAANVGGDSNGERNVTKTLVMRRHNVSRNKAAQSGSNEETQHDESKTHESKGMNN
jgi:hypothetical protein